MVNPQYIEYLNTIGADIDLDPRTLKPTEPPEQLDKTQLKAHIAKGLPPIATARIDDLPFKIKIDELEEKEYVDFISKETKINTEEAKDLFCLFDGDYNKIKHHAKQKQKISE